MQQIVFTLGLAGVMEALTHIKRTVACNLVLFSPVVQHTFFPRRALQVPRSNY